MIKRIRIKPYLHLLQRGETVDFIKTLDEEAKLPSGVFFDGFIAILQNLSEEDEILARLTSTFQLPLDLARQFLDRLFALGIIEYYYEKLPAALHRYHRQLLLFDSMHPQVNFEDNYARQQKLQQTHVLILGLGGIGNFIALSLAAAGVGKLSLADHDVVEESNLNRQVLFDQQSIGQSKAAMAAARLQNLHPAGEIAFYQTDVHSRDMLETLLLETGKPDYLVLSADQPVDLVLWASALCAEYGFKYLKCGYMAYQGLIGPLLGPETRKYEAIFQSWSDEITAQPQSIQRQNALHTAPSMAASNAILANIAALEMIKDITGVIPSVLIEKRLLFNLKTMEMYYEGIG